ncbi:unnamed protein product [Clonostachys rhizophaga]|uniref:DUF6594 domain-containing protein n=1 Tax=Clonostachys rhizophaga TaxID=160324 RepID=A0A9N9VLC9_9HYPO|nr:unnamed protein product [Clonostachys rhizophaga]
MATDEEQANISVHYVTGFGELASLIASDEDQTTAVYKRFDKLAARDLLYYECELLELEALQDQYDREDSLDARKPDNADNLQRRIRTNARDWVSFKHRAMKEAEANDKSDERWKKRMDLAMEVRSTLKEYREALLLNSTLLTLRPLSKQTLTALSNYFHQQHGFATSSASQQATLPTLSGAGSRLYPLPGTPTSQRPIDLVSVSPQTHADPLGRILKTYCSWLFQPRSAPPSTFYSSSPSLSAPHPAMPLVTHLHPPQLQTYSLRFLSFAASLITALLVCSLLLLPIYGLWSASSSRLDLKLGLIALFTILFAFAIPLVTNARRAELFGACAAYAAVLVVFISGGLGGEGGADRTEGAGSKG